MDSQKIENKTQTLTESVKRINNWIKQHPEVTDPNAYEIMDCNVSLAELLSEYAQIDNSRVLQNAAMKHPEIEPCYFGVVEMDELRDTAHHSFFQSQEANDLYCAIKQSQLSMNYDIPEELETRKIKKELLCKSMSVAFYIWQVHRNEPDYQYDNTTEFNEMKLMLDIYKQEGNTQFVPEREAMFHVIENNYQYGNKAMKNIHK